MMDLWCISWQHLGVNNQNLLTGNIFSRSTESPHVDFHLNSSCLDPTNAFALSLRFFDLSTQEWFVKHYRVRYKTSEDVFFVFRRAAFNSVEQLIEHHSSEINWCASVKFTSEKKQWTIFSVYKDATVKLSIQQTTAHRFCATDPFSNDSLQYIEYC